MHLDNSFISTTLCDDLARATEAQDGKKICKPTWPRRTSWPGPVKTTPTTLKPGCQSQREAVGENWQRLTCKRHIKDKTLEETRSPETIWKTAMDTTLSG